MEVVAVLLVVLVVDASVLGLARADAVGDAQQEAFARLLESALVPELPHTRREADGSVTLYGLVQDEPGAMTRTVVHELPTLAGADPDTEAGLFVRNWTGPQGQPLVTVGAYERNGAETRNVNLFVLEGAAGVESALDDAARRDALPLVLNSLPYLLNLAHPTSVVMVLAMATAVAALHSVLSSAGLAGPALLLLDASPYLLGAPILDAAYPYHLDARQGEVYRDWPEVYVWHALARVPGGAAVWQGHYLNRTGAYDERLETRGDGDHRLAVAWKRDVVGPAVRVGSDTTNLPGIYLKQSITRDHTLRADGTQRLEARQDVTAGAYSEATGESPGANVRMDETKEGEQVVMHVARQQDTLSLGLKWGDAYLPLLGARTEAWHRPYTDVTNQGAAIAALESYRLTSVGFYEVGRYIAVFGADSWGERNPADGWALAWALGGVLGDQLAGDAMARAGVFVNGRFVAVAGARLDDDFAGHRHENRSMLSAGLFQADPLDPGRRVPGESPDRARFVPLVASTYDGAASISPWALGYATNKTAEMGSFLVAAGAMGASRDRYLPVVGIEFLAEAHQGQRHARETYRVGVFPADYALFVPLAGLSYDGDSTSFVHAGRTVAGAIGNGREGAFHTAPGVYVGGAFVPLAGLRYEPAGTPSHAHGYSFTLGTYGLDGAFSPLVEARVAFAQPPVGTSSTCDVQVQLTHLPTGSSHAVTPPCVVAPAAAPAPYVQYEAPSAQ